MDPAVPPVNVSPLIKGARWGLLLLGIVYGSTRYSLLYNAEQKRLAELERTRPEREAKAAIERAARQKMELEEFEKQLGTIKQ